MSSFFWRNRKVFITGHTGFKGTWLLLLLKKMGADIHGYALPPQSGGLFELLDGNKYLSSSTLGDICDEYSLGIALKNSRAEVILHLAAQPLVLDSYKDPVNTYRTNVLGTLNLIEAIRKSDDVKSFVNITTDKVYENREWYWPYRESDQLGGHDPYASSKACSEILTSSYFRSFFNLSNVGFATARSGNVIGGGDWSSNRIIPDFFRAAHSHSILEVRNRYATRPWQHVLDPLSGYLNLAESLFHDFKTYSGAWNFGPDNSSTKSVFDLVNELLQLNPQVDVSFLDENKQKTHESSLLELDCAKSRQQLAWKPKWDFKNAVQRTSDWYNCWSNTSNLTEFTEMQLSEFTKND